MPRRPPGPAELSAAAIALTLAGASPDQVEAIVSAIAGAAGGGR